MLPLQNKKVLFTCMDWGLGHATRSIPLIKKLIAEGNTVTLASSGYAKKFLEEYFPELTVYSKPGYEISYSAWLPMALVILQQSASILKTIDEEQKWTQDRLADEKYDVIFSDNCYGVYSTNIPSYIITHQLMLKTPPLLRFSERILHRILLKWISNFKGVLIPDVENENNLSGDLSHLYPLPQNVEWIGPQSRFSSDEKINPYAEQVEVFAIVSGPEPQRTFLEANLEKILSDIPGHSIIIRGLPGNYECQKKGNVHLYNHISDADFRGIIEKSKLIVSRSGYSTIMDLEVLKKKALLIPTPGQTEQEYLAEYLGNKKHFSFAAQKDLSKNLIEELLRS
ncbi:MAG: glycosyltransferase family protein [Bacteroidia bacterium]